MAPAMPDVPRPDDVETLAGWVDETSRETYVSVYVDLTDPGHRDELARRRREIRTALEDGEATDRFDTAWDDAVEELEALTRTADADGAAVFTSAVDDRREAFALAEPLPTRVVWDSSPYVRPLARFLDAYEDLAVVVVDGDRAAIHLVEAARAREVEERSTDLQGRHSKGGWSQMRFQRRRQAALEGFLDETVEHLRRLVEEEDVQRIMVAGSGQVKDQLVNRLPPRLADRVATVEDVDVDPGSKELVERFVEQGRKLEAEGSGQAVQALKAALKRGELAVMGPFETVRAARDGRIELLVAATGTEPGAAKCEAHATFFEQGDRCSCGSEGTPVDLINEAVEYVARADGRIEFVDADAPFLEAMGGVGALLRW